MGNHKNTREKYHLPEPTGPYSVGAMDIMSDADNKPCFFRLLYPIEKQNILLSDYEWPLWIDHPKYIEGLVEFLKKRKFIYTHLLNWLYGKYYIPVLKNHPPRQTATPFPVIVFSHGMGGNRFYCSTLCNDIASHGFLVACVEHQDGSGSMAYFLEPGTSGARGSGDSPGSPTYQKRWTSYELYPKNFYDFQFHNRHLRIRSMECVWALDILEKLNNGESVQNILDPQSDFSAFQGSMNMSNVSVVGHSFGGTTCAFTMFQDTRFKVAVSIDAWLYPLEPHVYKDLKQPMLFVNMALFQWNENIDKMKRFMTDDLTRKIITVRDTVHQSTTDFQFMMSPSIARLIKIAGPLDPTLAIRLQVQSTLTFLRHHLGLSDEVDVLTDDNIIHGARVFRTDDVIVPPEDDPFNAVDTKDAFVSGERHDTTLGADTDNVASSSNVDSEV